MTAAAKDDMKNKLLAFSLQLIEKCGLHSYSLQARSYKLAARNRGFTLLLAALVASIVLSLGASIYEIAVKEVTLSSLGRDSQYAFYAADAGAECALYWDLRFGYFGTSSPSTVIAPDPRCATQTLVAAGRSAVFPYTMTFEYAPNGYCVNIAVQKTLDPVTAVVRTTIHSDGFSTPCETRATSARTLQRSVELHY